MSHPSGKTFIADMFVYIEGLQSDDVSKLTRRSSQARLIGAMESLTLARLIKGVGVTKGLEVVEH